MWKLKLALQQAKQWVKKHWLAIALTVTALAVLKSAC